jgi:hypothetical protein
VNLDIASFSTSVVFQVRIDRDGVDVVIGLHLLRAHGIDVWFSSLSISIPSPSGPIVANAAPQQPLLSDSSLLLLKL